MSMRNPQNERYTVEREGRSQGSVKPRTASAKPASKAGASVRTTSKPKPKNAKQRAMAEMNMSKEEKKAARAKEREAENVAYTAIDILTRKDARYKKLRRIWWVLLVVAVIFMVLSWATVSMPLAVNIVSLILAYAAIISALVMDFTVVRKCRNKHRDKVASMTRKQQERIVYEAQVEAGAKAAAKAARKEAKKAGKSAAEIEAAAKEACDMAMAGVKPADDSEAADQATAKDEEPKKKAKQPAAPLTPEEERLAAAAQVAREFANSKR